MDLIKTLAKITNKFNKTPTDEAKPKTYVQSGGQKKTFFDEKKRSQDYLLKLWNIYVQGGLYSQAIDAYAYAVLANGWRLEGDQTQVDIITQNFSEFDINSIIFQGIVHSLVLGDGFQEVVYTRGGGAPIKIVSRQSWSFDIDADGHGTIKNFVQTLPDMNPVRLKPEQVVHIQLNPSGDLYGISLFGRAYDDIMRDTKTAEATAEAIDRHGFKKWQIKVGQPGIPVKQEVIKDISKQFEVINTKNEFTTPADVDIKDLDEGGLERMEEYSNVSLMRVAAALGVPEEVIGVRRGTTDATAVTRIETWLKTKISYIQQTVSRIYTLQYINRIVPPGSVRFVFNDVSDQDELTRSRIIGTLVTAYGGIKPENVSIVDDVVPRRWVKQLFSIEDIEPQSSKTTPKTESNISE
jgi:hypothetical protein